MTEPAHAFPLLREHPKSRGTYFSIGIVTRKLGIVQIIT